MKQFIRSISIFCLPLLLTAYPLDLFISHNLKHSQSFYGEYEVWNDIYNNAINAETLIYGSSRAWVDIDPNIIEGSLNTTTYNLGLDGHSFWLQYLRHLEYMKNNAKPKHILLAVDINSLQKRETLYQYQQFLPYMIGNKNIKTYTQSYKGFKKLDYYIPLVRYFGETSTLKEAYKMLLTKSSDSNYRTQGYRGIKKDWNGDLKLAKSKMVAYDIKLDQASVQLFNDFLSEAKKHNIKITLIYTPEYIEGQKFIKDRATTISLFKNAAKKHNLLFLDYSKDSICLSKDYFYNATHLNDKGSKLFTKTLVSDLRKTKTLDN